MKVVSRVLVLSFALVTLLLMSPATLWASPVTQDTPANQNAPADAATHSWTIDQVVTDTVSDAWHQGGETEPGFFNIVKTMAEFAAEKRGLTLPESKAAGKRAGDYIKQQARLDHQQLLYPIVDRAVRLVGKPAADAASTTAPAQK